MPSASFRVSVSKDDLVFSSAHFITFSGGRCEGLHGHNYRVRVTVDGQLDQDALVFDFVELRRIMRHLCEEIDHLVLLPTKSSRIQVSEGSGVVSVSVDGAPRYTFPRADCALLPIQNTTAEMLAELLATRLKDALAGASTETVTAIELEIEETPGQSAICRLDVR